MSGLSYCYMQGCGVDADGKEAYRWADKAADLKHPCGIFRLGVCYEMGHGVSIDRKRMLELYQEADEMGSVNARMGLFVAHYHGNGVKQDRDAALVIANELVSGPDWFFAAMNVVTDYGREEAGGDAAFERALACVSRHASLGLPQAIRFQAHYQRENGLLDDEQFIHQIIEAARQGDGVAYRNLSADVENREDAGYNLPVYSKEGTFHDMGILAVARGLNVHTNMKNAWQAIEAYGNGGDVCPRNLGAARDIAQKWLLAGRELTSEYEQFHRQMAYLYTMGVRFKVKGFEREDLAVAHAVYRCATDAKCMKWLQWFHRGYFPGFHRDIAKAYVTAKLAHEMKDDYTIRREYREAHRGAAQGSGLEGNQAPAG